MILNKDCAFNGKKIEFPIDYNIKIIMDGTIPDELNKNEILKIFNALEIPNKEWKKRMSKEGKYVSFTISVNIKDQETFDRLYKDLNEIKGVKWAV